LPKEKILMISFRLRSHVGADGTLNVQVPTEFRETDVEVLVVLNPVLPSNSTPSYGEWPDDYFESTYGCCKDEPLARLPQGKPDVREALQ
jgi:hypothetical protein